MSRAYSMNGGEEEHIYVIGRNVSKKETTGKTRRMWMDTIKMDLR
jgi:hypothetical protein